MEHGLQDGNAEEYEPHGADNPSTSIFAHLPPAIEEPGAPPAGAIVPVVSGPRPTTIAVAFAAYGLSPSLQGGLLSVFLCTADDLAEAMASTPENEIPEILSELSLDLEERAPYALGKRPCPRLLQAVARGLRHTTSVDSSGASPVRPHRRANA